MIAISPELIGSIFTGLTGLLAALAAFTANRNRRISEDSKAIRRQARTIQKKLLAALTHIFTLEHELAERGIPVPARPEVLEQDDDDDGPAPKPAGANASA